MKLKLHRTICFVLIFLFAFSGLIFADTGHHGVGNIDDGIQSDNEGLLFNSTTREFHEDNKPGYGERFTAGIIISMVNWVMNLFHMSDPVLLVFGKDPRIDDTEEFLTGGLYGADPRDELVMGTFPEAFFSAVSILYTAFERLLPIPLAIAIVIIAIVIMINSGTTEGRSKQKDYLRAFLVAFIALRFGHYLWIWILAINHFLIDLIWAYMMDNGVLGGFFLDMIWGTGRSGIDEAAQIGSIALAILLFLAAMMCITLNYQYTIRMIFLGMLILLFPIVVTLSVFPAFRHSLTTWVQEFVANTVMQLAHAIALGGFFITMAMPGIGEGAGFWLMIAYFAGLPAIVNLVRGLIGLQGGSGGMGGMSAMMGLMAVTNMARMLKPNKGASGGVADGGGVTGGDTGDGGGSIGKVAGGFSELSGATSGIGKTAQGIYNTAGKIASNPTVQKAAKVGLGATAAIAGGAISGMATGNPMAGLALGAGAGMAAGKAGGWALGKAGSTAHSAVEGAVGTAGSIGEKLSGAKDNIMSDSMAKGGIVSSVAQAGWGLENAINKVSSKMGGGKPFSAAGHASDFINSNKEMISQSAKGMKEIKPDLDIATAKYEQMKAQYGKGSRWHEFNAHPQTGKVVMPEEYKKAEQNYNGLKSQYDSHRANLMKAQANLKNYNKLKEYTENMRKDDTNFSQSRGRL